MLHEVGDLLVSIGEREQCGAQPAAGDSELALQAGNASAEAPQFPLHVSVVLGERIHFWMRVDRDARPPCGLFRRTDLDDHSRRFRVVYIFLPHGPGADLFVVSQNPCIYERIEERLVEVVPVWLSRVPYGRVLFQPPVALEVRLRSMEERGP